MSPALQKLQLQRLSITRDLQLKNVLILCISQLKPRPPDPRDIAGNLTFTNTAAKRMRMRQIWHFRFAQFFLVLCLLSRKFYKVCNKQLSLLLQQESLKGYAFLFLNFISLSGKEIPKILAAMQGVRTSVSVIINRCLLFSSS